MLLCFRIRNSGLGHLVLTSLLLLFYFFFSTLLLPLLKEIVEKCAKNMLHNIKTEKSGV